MMVLHVPRSTKQVAALTPGQSWVQSAVDVPYVLIVPYVLCVLPVLQVVQEPAYNVLRTQEQLGYTVSGTGAVQGQYMLHMPILTRLLMLGFLVLHDPHVGSMIGQLWFPHICMCGVCLWPAAKSCANLGVCNLAYLCNNSHVGS